MLHAVQIKTQFYHMHTRFAKQTDHSAFGVLRNRFRTHDETELTALQARVGHGTFRSDNLLFRRYIVPNLRTHSERLFAKYLYDFKYKWEYEQPSTGRAKVPDFLVERGEARCLCDVKERSPKLPPPGARCFDPIKGIRKLIENGREKFREYDNQPCALVLFNNGDCDTRLDPVNIYGAMLGEPGCQFDFDFKTCTLDPDSARNVFLDRGGKMVRHYAPLEPHNSTRHISAIVAMTTSRPSNPKFKVARERECRSEAIRLGKELSAEQELEIVYSLLQTTPATLDEVTRLTVCINPFALHPLSDSLFDGPYDERWAIVDGTLTKVFAGTEIDALSDD
jgi:hypothetical protein